MYNIEPLQRAIGIPITNYKSMDQKPKKVTKNKNFRESAFLQI